MSLQSPQTIAQHPLASAAAGLKIYLIDGTSQVLDSNGRLPVGVSGSALAALLANGFTISSAS